MESSREGIHAVRLLGIRPSDVFQLELLTEIIKASAYPPEHLLHIVRQLPEPRWEDMPLPRGRSLNQCRAVYYEYVRQGPPTQLIGAATMREPPRPLDVTAATQRPYPVEGPSSAPMSASRYQDIQPRPPVAIGGLLNASPPVEPPRKKRGRPTKAESEMRREAARQRAESFPAPLRRDNPQPGPSTAPSMTATQAAQAVMTPQLQTLPRPTGPQEDPDVKRKRLKSEADAQSRLERSESVPAASTASTGPVAGGPDSYHGRAQSRDYPDILSHHPSERPSSFRAPRGGE